MIRSDDTDNIHYRSVGDGPALLCIAGFGGLGSFWQQQQRALAPDFRVVTFDQRGTGRSPWREGASLETMAEDALAVMDAAGIAQATIVGHSTGGAIAQVLAARHPERVERLVLSSSWIRPSRYFQRLFRLRRALLDQDDLSLFHQFGVFFRYSPDHLEENDALFEAAPSIDRVATAARIAVILESDLSAEAESIAMPTQIVGARDDRLVPLESTIAILASIPHARLEVMPDGGHFLPETRAAAYTALLRAFIASS